MNNSLIHILICLAIGMAVIILLTAKYRVHAFFALLIACFVVGLGIQMPADVIISTAKTGFGNIMQSLGLIIVLGTTLGVLLEHSGSTRVMATYILKKAGEKNASLAMNITGFIVGLPIFCDSGYIVLSGLNQTLAKRSGIPVIIMSVSLATGLYSVHCLIPPHPGAAAAAGTLGADFGKLILYGMIVAVPAMLAGRWWALYAGKKLPVVTKAEKPEEPLLSLPSTISAFLPVVVPIVLIAIRSFLSVETILPSGWVKFFSFLGDPVIALTIGILLVIVGSKLWIRYYFMKLLPEATEKAGSILVIIGAGGAFGAILAATEMGKHFGTSFPLKSMGILFPFLLTFILKTAQGSSTVAIITAAAIIEPLLPVLGLTTPNERILTVLAMGAGSMMISHANDAYFWVIAKFSGLEARAMLKVYTVATIFMGLVALLIVYLLGLAIV